MDSPKTFHEFAARCHEEDPDFGKVDNSDPTTLFAFELQGDFEVFRVAEMSLLEAQSQLISIDDFGSPVTIIPLDVTSYEGSVGFDDYGFDFSEFSGRPMTSSEFVWRLSLHIAHDVFRNPDDYDLAFDPKDLKELVFHRFYYSDSDEYWSIVFQSKSESGRNGV